MSRERILAATLILVFVALLLGWIVGFRAEAGIQTADDQHTAAAAGAAATPGIGEEADAASLIDSNEIATKRHRVHPQQESLWVERMHASLGLPFHGALEPDLKASIDAALSQAGENCTSAAATAQLDELSRSASPTARKRYHQTVHGIALLFGQLEALAKDAYLRYGGDDFLHFYETCMNRYPDHYFACVGCDRMGRQILLVVPAPPKSQIATAADAALALAQQGF